MASFAELLSNAHTGTLRTRNHTSTGWTVLTANAARKAGWLRNLHDRQPIGVVMANETQAIETFVAAYLSGRGVVSLPLPHRGQHPARYAAELDTLAKAAGCTTVFVPDELADDTHPGYHTIGESRPHLEDSFIIQCSSGTTATPKLVPLTSRQLVINLTEMRDVLDLTPPFNTASWLPLAHDMGLIGMLFVTWISGGNLTLSNPTDFLRNPMSWLDDCDTAHITGVPNFALDVVTRRSERGHTPRSSTDLTTVRHIILGGEPVQATTLRNFHDVAAPWGIRPEAYTPAYGMAEICLTVTCDHLWRPPHVTVDGDHIDVFTPAGAGFDTAGAPVLLGRPLPANHIDIDSDGRIIITSPALTDGYLDEPPLRGRLVTSDSGRIEHGELIVHGRVDDVIVVRGRKIWPETLENAVGTITGKPGGTIVINVDGHIVAIAETHDTTITTARHIRAVCVAATGIGPDVVVFTEPGTLPKTSSGKKKRAAVKQAYSSGRLDGHAVIWKVAGI